MTATDDFEPTSRHWMSQGLKLHYLDWGNEGAPVLLLVHGNRDHARSWDATARALRHDWHVIAPDLRGHGDSARSSEGAYLAPYHMMDLADLIEQLGEAQVTIIAHSFGGNMSLRFTALYPDRVRKLVVVDGLGPSPANKQAWEQEGPLPRTRAWIEKRREADRPARPLPSIEEGAARLAKANPRLSPEQARHLAIHGLRREGDGYVWKWDPRVSIFAPEDFQMENRWVWNNIKVPALLFHGAESWTTNPEADGRAAHFPDVRVIGWPDAGHWVHHDQFERFIGEVKAFI